MADPVSWAAIGGLVLAAGASGTQAYQASQAADAAKDQARQQTALAEEEFAAQEQQKADVEKQRQAAAKQASDAALRSARRGSLGAGARAGTLLTSPLGIPQSQQAKPAAKTLLGA